MRSKSIRRAVGFEWICQRLWLCALLLCSIHCSTSSCDAATRTWDGGGTNAFWDTVTNWDNNAVPAGGDTVSFGSGFGSGATINLNGNRTANTLTISTLTGFTITNSTLTLSSGDITRSDLAGTETDHTITSAIALGADGAWNIAGSGSLIASGVISGANKLTKSGAGTLVLSGANTFSKDATLSAGTLALGNDSAAGTAGLVLDGGTVQAYGAARTIGNDLTLSADFTIGGTLDLTFTGGATLSTERIITVDNTGSSTFSGVISGAKKLHKAGAGTLILSGANTHNETYVDGGVLNIRNDTALSGTSKGTTVASGAALQLQGGITVGAEALDLSGNGIASDGALRNISGNNSWAGTITLGSASTIASDAGTLTISGNVVNGGFASTFTGAGDVTASGVISGTGGLTKSGAGTLTLSASNTFTGALAVNAGTLLLGANNRIADAVNVTMSGGKLSSGGYNETVGTLTLTADSIIDFGNATSVVHFAASTGVSWTASTVLLVTNWTGSYSGGGPDQLFFGSSTSGLTGTQLGQIQFVDNSGNRQLANILSNGEVVPVPEPATVIAVVLVAGLVLYREKKAIRQWLRRPLQR